MSHESNERAKQEKSLLEEFRAKDGTIIPEIVLASGKAQVQNIKAVIQFVNESRKLINAQNETIKALGNRLYAVEQDAKELRRQLSIVQGRLYAGGTAQFSDGD